MAYRDELTFAQLVGSVYSAMTPETIPSGAARETFEQQLRDTLAPAETFAEDVRFSIVVGRQATSHRGGEHVAEGLGRPS